MLKKKARWDNRQIITEHIRKPVRNTWLKVKKLTVDLIRKQREGSWEEKIMSTTRNMEKEEGWARILPTWEESSGISPGLQIADQRQTSQGTVGLGAGDREIFCSSRNIVSSAVELIRQYQSGELLPARTGYNYLDRVCMGGLYPKDIVAIGGRSGSGKSYFMQQILDAVMDKRINPQADDYVLVRCEFEMTPKDLIVRQIANKLGRQIEDVLTKELTGADLEIANNVINSFDDSRIFYVPFPVSIEEFSRNFRRRIFENEAFRKKKLILVSIDHIALIKRMGGDLKSTLDRFLAEINEMKLEYDNVCFLLSSQLNRNIESRKDNPNNHAPIKSDFYASDELAQYASVMVAVHNPYDLGLDKYMAFSENRYEWLNRFKHESKKSFKTRGLIFHHVLKIRQGDIDKFECIHVDVKPGFENVYREEGSVVYTNVPKPEPMYFLTGDQLEASGYSEHDYDDDDPF